jgi:hypothetical protein
MNIGVTGRKTMLRQGHHSGIVSARSALIGSIALLAALFAADGSTSPAIAQASDISASNILDPHTIGTWELQLVTGRWVWEIDPDGTYRFHSEASDGVAPNSGTFATDGGHWSLHASNGYTDGGTYFFEPPNTLVATGRLGTGQWHRVINDKAGQAAGSAEAQTLGQYTKEFEGFDDIGVGSFPPWTRVSAFGWFYLNNKTVPDGVERFTTPWRNPVGIDRTASLATLVEGDPNAMAGLVLFNPNTHDDYGIMLDGAGNISGYHVGPGTARPELKIVSRKSQSADSDGVSFTVVDNGTEQKFLSDGDLVWTISLKDPKNYEVGFEAVGKGTFAFHYFKTSKEANEMMANGVLLQGGVWRRTVVDDGDNKEIMNFEFLNNGAYIERLAITSKSHNYQKEAVLSGQWSAKLAPDGKTFNLDVRPQRADPARICFPNGNCTDLPLNPVHYQVQFQTTSKAVFDDHVMDRIVPDQ